MDEITFWIQMGWWENPNVLQMREASHKAALEKLFDDWEGDIKMLLPGIVEEAKWRLRSFGPAIIMGTPGYVGSSLVDIEAQSVDGL